MELYNFDVLNSLKKFLGQNGISFLMFFRFKDISFMILLFLYSKEDTEFSKYTSSKFFGPLDAVFSADHENELIF